jgi:predicted nucleic acid-binding protein
VRNAEDAVRLLLNLPIVEINPVDLDLGQESAQLAIDLRLRGADAVYVALARRLGMPLVTWDGEQRERARSAVRVATPEEALQT